MEGHRMTDFVELKQRTSAQLHGLARGADPATAYHSEALWWGCHPFNEREGLDETGEVWRLMRAAFPDT